MPESQPSNPGLLAALTEAAGGGSAQKRQSIFGELLKSRLLLQIAGPPKDAASGVQLMGLKAADGRMGLAAFTDVASLQLWDPKAAHFVTVPAPGVFRMALDAGFDVMIINPPGIGWEIGKAELAALAGGNVPQTVPETTGTMVRIEIHPVASPIPAPALDWLRERLLPRQEIRSCHFFMAAFGGESAKLCLGVRLALPTDQWSAFMESLEPELAGAPPIDGGFALGPVADEMLEGVERFGTVVFKR